MSGNEHARQLLRLAQKDLNALSGMPDSGVFAEEIFGFHAQQTAEKALKAWIASLGVEFPMTHNIATLLGVLEKSGRDVSSLWSLVEYNPFGVSFRYEEMSATDIPLDRQKVFAELQSLLLLVESEVF